MAVLDQFAQAFPAMSGQEAVVSTADVPDVLEGNDWLLTTLVAFGVSGISELPPTVLAWLGEPLSTFAQMTEGRAATAEWAEIFSRTLAELASFRALKLEHPEQVSLEDLRLVMDAQGRALQGYRDWLSGCMDVEGERRATVSA